MPVTESDDSRCCSDTICLPEDGHITARNMSNITSIMYEICSERKERLRIQPAQLFHCARSVIWCVQ